MRNGVTAQVRLTPRATKAGVGGIRAAADGSVALVVAVSAPPAEGKANVALLRLLADIWDVPKSNLSIVSGAKSREKRVMLTGDPAVLMARLSAWEATIHD